MSNAAPPIDPDLEWFSILVKELQDMGFDAATANRYAAILIPFRRNGERDR